MKGGLLQHRFRGVWRKTAFLSFLLANPAQSWTLKPLPDRRSTVALSVGFKTTEPSQLDCQPLSRREALLLGCTGVASVFSIPGPSHAGTAGTTDVLPLLSDYLPSGYKTLPSYGRSVFPPSFLPPLTNRATYRYSLGRGAWALEQLIAFTNVTATIRTNVIELEDGGLWVSGPLWPTEEYCALLDELGPVRYAVLPTNALEHKAAMKQFLLKYPDAEVWISPGQYGPFGECGVVTEDMDEKQVNDVVSKATKTMGYRVDGILPVKLASPLGAKELQPKNMFPPWAETFHIEVLCVDLPGNAGPVSECAFVHKPSKTLAVVDAVICVPSVKLFELQPIFSTYFDSVTLEDPGFWQRTVLQAVFLPLRTESNQSGISVYPGYEALADRLVRAPILRAFVDARAPNAVLTFVESICLQEFDRIITAHFASPINAGPDLFSKAFVHLNQDTSYSEVSSALPIECQDWSTLNSLNTFIDDNNLGAPIALGYDFRRGCKSSD
ncbi:hypothetical protein ACHAWF_006460 [Thalassiosira exigua]